jgi:hypothetical protein
MTACAIASDTKLETPEGPLTVKTVGNSPTAVMTRTDEGLVRFAMSSEVRKVAEAQPVLRIVLDNGRALRVGAEQRLFDHAMEPRRVGDLQAGDALVSAFAFPAGYEYVTDDGETVRSNGSVKIVSIEAGGEADLYSLKIALTGRFVFSSGVIGAAEA